MSTTVHWSLLFLPAPNVTQAPVLAHSDAALEMPWPVSYCESSYIFKQLQKQYARETTRSLQNLKYVLSGSFQKTYANLCPRVTGGQLLPML